jgi:hypothetical protein
VTSFNADARESLPGRAAEGQVNPNEVSEVYRPQPNEIKPRSSDPTPAADVLDRLLAAALRRCRNPRLRAWLAALAADERDDAQQPAAARRVS